MIDLLRRFWASEDGTSTVEFVVLFPGFFLLFMSTFELGMLLTRQVMLDRGLDMAVNQVRLGALRPVTQDSLKALVCQGAMMIPSCMSQVKLEMRIVDPRNWSTIPARADCVDRSKTVQPASTFEIGKANQLVVVRACALYDPYFPTSGLGFQLHRINGSDAVALISNTAFAIEPD